MNNSCMNTSFAYTTTLLWTWLKVVNKRTFFFSLGPFVSTDVIKVMTSSASFFCSVECLKVPYCKSYAFLKTAETDNCHLGSTEEGLATQTEADVYKLDASSITVCRLFLVVNTARILETDRDSCTKLILLNRPISLSPIELESLNPGSRQH